MSNVFFFQVSAHVIKHVFSTLNQTSSTYFPKDLKDTQTIWLTLQTLKALHRGNLVTTSITLQKTQILNLIVFS